MKQATFFLRRRCPRADPTAAGAAACALRSCARTHVCLFVALHPASATWLAASASAARAYVLRDLRLHGRERVREKSEEGPQTSLECGHSKRAGFLCERRRVLDRTEIKRIPRSRTTTTPRRELLLAAPLVMGNATTFRPRVCMPFGLPRGADPRHCGELIARIVEEHPQLRTSSAALKVPHGVWCSSTTAARRVASATC